MIGHGLTFNDLQLVSKQVKLKSLFMEGWSGSLTKIKVVPEEQHQSIFYFNVRINQFNFLNAKVSNCVFNKSYITIFEITQNSSLATFRLDLDNRRKTKQAF